mmetsp:Transcript_6985/g.15307  ORF Transcript_6985/g.15307 Transcript_6985/m.15307 type:complete len:351 (-) Transcript_6985:259-1311(-)
MPLAAQLGEHHARHQRIVPSLVALPATIVALEPQREAHVRSGRTVGHDRAARCLVQRAERGVGVAARGMGEHLRVPDDGEELPQRGLELGEASGQRRVEMAQAEEEVVEQVVPDQRTLRRCERTEDTKEASSRIEILQPLLALRSTVCHLLRLAHAVHGELALVVRRTRAGLDEQLGRVAQCVIQDSAQEAVALGKLERRRRIFGLRCVRVLFAAGPLRRGRLLTSHSEPSLDVSYGLVHKLHISRLGRDHLLPGGLARAAGIGYAARRRSRLKQRLRLLFVGLGVHERQAQLNPLVKVHFILGVKVCRRCMHHEAHRRLRIWHHKEIEWAGNEPAISALVKEAHANLHE